MKWYTWVSALLLVVLAMPEETSAAGNGRTFQVHNRLRVEYDDNIYQRETDETDSDRRLAWDGRDRDYRPVPAGSYLYVVYDGNTKFRTGMCGVVR